MRKFILAIAVIVFNVLNPLTSAAQDTLKVVNWNMEFFGDISSQLPEEIQKSRVIMNNIYADVFALVEMVNVDSLHSLIASLDDNYGFLISPFGSFASSPNSNDYPSAQKLAFVYKTSKIRNVSGRAFLKNSIGSAYYNWASGRFPYFINAEAKDKSGNWQPIKFVILHAKANADNKSCTRRYDGGLEMKDSLDAYYPNDKIIILGDFNDDFDVSICGGSSNYEYLVKDSTGNNFYRSPTLPLSVQGLASISGYPSFIDHVVISDELVNDYVKGSARLLKTDVENWVSNYEDDVSDHYPVETKYLLLKSTFANSLVHDENDFLIYPNPASKVFYIKNENEKYNRYKLISLDGKVIASANLDKSITLLSLDAIAEGFYFIQLEGLDVRSRFQKLIVAR